MKKKLLALLLAVWMVVAMLPMTVLAEALPTNQTESSAVSRPTVEIESLTPGTAVTVLDETGEIVVESAQDLATAILAVKEGYTLKLTAGTLYSCDAALVLESPACAWTLDGNGAVLCGGTADDFLLTVGGAGSDVTVKNLTVASMGSGVKAGLTETDRASALTLENVRVFAGGSYDSANASGNGAAYVVSGPASYLRIVGDDTYAYAPNANDFFICNYGQLGIYAGVFANGDAGACSAYILTRSYNTANSDSAVRYAPTTTVYGGTFVGSTSTTTMIRSDYGGTNIIRDGVFILLNTASTPILAGAANGYGYNYVYGGEFYSKSAGKIYNPTVANNTYTEFAGGTFYGQTAESIVNSRKTTKVTGDYLTQVYFGTRVDAYYKATASTASVTIDNKNGDYHLVDEANGTYTNVTTVGYNTANTTVSAKLAAVGGDLARIAEVADIEMTESNTPISKFFFDFEIDRALRSVSDGGKVMLLRNITRTVNSADSTLYAAISGVQGHILSPYFSYTLTGKGSASYTLSVECVGTTAETCYALNFFGGNITVENVNLLLNQESLCGILETSYEGNYTVLTLRNVTVTSNGAPSAVMQGQDGSVLNVYEGVTLQGSSVEIHGSNGTFNMWGGTLKGDQNVVYVVAGAQGNEINVWDGTLQSSNRIFYDFGMKTVLNVRGGTLTGLILIEENGTESVISFGAEDGSTAPTQGTVSPTPLIFNGGSESILNIYGGTYTASQHCVWLRKGPNQTVNIYGGTLICTDAAKHAAIYVDSGYTCTGCKINIYDCDLESSWIGMRAYLTDNEFTVYGGTFRSVQNIFHDNGTRTKISLYGGSFTTDNSLIQGNGNSSVYTIGEAGAASSQTLVANAKTIVHFNGGSKNVANIQGGALIALTHGVNFNGGSSQTANVIGGKLISAGTGNLIQNKRTDTTLKITGGVLMVGSPSAYFVYTEAANASIKALPGVAVDSDGKGGLSAATSSFVGEHGGIAYRAWINTAATDADYAPEMKTGAQVRMATDSNGLRFVSTVSAEAVAALEGLADAGTAVSYGTLIVPISYVVDAQGVFTHAGLKAADKNVVDIVATANGTTTAQDGSKTVRAALVNIKTENYNLAYAAVSYAKVTVGGEETYFYGAFSSIYNVRSLRQTCDAALRSAQPSAGMTNGVYYGYASIVSGISGFSRYNNAQQRVLAQYAGLRVSE